MISGRWRLAGFSAFTFGLSLGIFSPTAASAASPITTLDVDHDGTLDLDETKKAASAIFDQLDKDQDSTLDLKEAGSRLSVEEFHEANLHGDKTLSREEYLAFAEKLFNAADRDKDGTLDAKELDSKAGLALTRLIQ